MKRKIADIAFPIRPRVQKRPWNDDYVFWLVGYDIPGGTDYRNAKRYVVTEVELTEFSEGSEYPAPSFTVPNLEIQGVMDELWRAGVRPTEVGTAGHVAAVQAHADHMEKMLEQVLPSALRKP